MKLRQTILAGLAVSAALAAALAVRAEDAKKPAPLIEKGAKFLLASQNENGSWGEIPNEKEKGEIGVTALVVLGLARCPKTDACATCADAASKGAAWLAAKQGPDGAITLPSRMYVTYWTSLSVVALQAVDAAKYKDVIAKSVAWLKKAQFDEEEGTKPDNPHYGGFGYDKKGEKPDADLSNTQFALAALKEAGVSPDDPVFKRAIEFVQRCQNNPETNKGVPGVLKPKSDGGFVYGPARGQSTSDEESGGAKSYESYAGMTYAGLVSFIYAGVSKDDPRVKAALGWIKQHYTLEENYGLGVRAKDPKAAQQGMYYYYLTFAKALAAKGDAEIETDKGKRRWAADLVDVLASKQKPDGSWVNENAARWMEGNPLLATAYAVNALEIAAPFAK